MYELLAKISLTLTLLLGLLPMTTEAPVLGGVLGGANSQSNYARIENGVVTQVIVADQAFINRIGGESAGWKEVRNDNTSTKDDADVGDTYDQSLSAYIKPKPRADATLDTQTAKWVIPPHIKTQAERDFFVASST